MTVKTRKLIKHLETSNTLMEAGIKAGYSPTAGAIYNKSIKVHIAEAIGNKPELIIKRFEDLAARCRLKGDLATEKGVYDSLARINGMNKDKTDITLNKGINPEVIDNNMIENARKKLLEQKPNI